MFFPEKIKSIKSGDRVLEIGPGAFPHPRADVFLERIFNGEKEKIAQSGYEKPIILNKPVFYYDGGAFPFQDKEFDYVICSHVIEHVERNNLTKFISEIQRVSSGGYIEFPNVFYELLNFQPVHIWFMHYRNGKMYFLDKKSFKTSPLHQCIRAMFYGKNPYAQGMFEEYKDFFFVGYEWQTEICFEIVENFAMLIEESDVEDFRKKFGYTLSD